MDQADTLRQMLAPRRADEPIRVIAVTSGKGGVGKSHLSANLAVLAAQAGKRVLVVDGDLGLANVEILYGITPKYHLGDLLKEDMSLNDVLATGPYGVRVLSAGNGIQELTRLQDAQKMQLMRAFDELESAFDVVFFDTGAGIGDNVLFFAGGAQEALLVVTPEPTSLTDAYASVKALSQNAGVEHFGVVVNMARSDAAARDLFRRLCLVCSRFLSAKLRFVGHVPRDENIHRAVMAQRPLVEAFPQAPASRAMTTIADRVLSSGPTPSAGGLKFFWQGLLRSPSAPNSGAGETPTDTPR